MKPGPLKTHGGKAYLAPKLVALFPPHLTYVEPFAGGLSVLLHRNPNDERLLLAPHKGVSEVVNDLDCELITFWMVLRDEGQFDRFRRRVEATPFSELDWISAATMLDIPPSEPWLRAWAFFVRARQSLAGRRDAFTSITKTRVRRGMNNEVSAWLTAVEGLPAVHERLRRVLILNRPALEVIRQFDAPETLYYLDPPYQHATRAAPTIYQHEMSDRDHEDLLDAVRACQGKVMLSGYRSDLYDERLRDWNRHEFAVPNNAAGGKTKRTMVECCWCNF